MTFVPYVLENEGRSERSYDLPSRMMKERIVFINGPVNEHMAHIVQMQLLYLASLDSTADIHMYINSPGGSVLAGLAIEDAMNSIACDVTTTASGMAMSMGAYLLSCGAKGKRFATEGCRIMCHMVSSGTQGTIADMKISLRETELLDDYLAARLAANCGKTLDEYRAATPRDFYLSSPEAVGFGLIDAVIEPKKKRLVA